MTILTRRSLVLAKPQTAKGSPATPTASDDAFLVGDLDINVDPNILERNVFRPSLSPDPVVVGRKLVTVTFGHELKGAGNTTDAPKVGTLLRGCGFSETDSDPNLVYTPISTGFTYMTLYVYLDGMRHIIEDALGTISLQGEAGGYVTATFTFTGSYKEPTNTTLPTSPTYESTLPPIFENASMSLFGHGTFVAQSFSFDCANEINPVDDINSPEGYDGVLLTGRAPSGTLNPEMVLPNTYNLFNKLDEGVPGEFTVTVGAGNNNQCVIEGPKVQLANITYGDRNGIRTADLDLRFTADSGDDEVTFTFNQTA